MSIIDTLVTDRTASDVAAGNDKGTYNASDLNRVTEAMEYLRSLLERYGYAVPGYEAVRSGAWTEEDVPSVSQMRRYLANVEALRRVLELPISTPPTPESMARLTWQRANEIEQILRDVEQVILHVLYGMATSRGYMTYSGVQPLPSVYIDYGRTWAELDNMGTKWSQWAAADWYLLLYGNLERGA